MYTLLVHPVVHFVRMVLYDYIFQCVGTLTDQISEIKDKCQVKDTASSGQQETLTAKGNLMKAPWHWGGNFADVAVF